jgi:hypothetical protein
MAVCTLLQTVFLGGNSKRNYLCTNERKKRKIEVAAAQQNKW